MKKILLTGAKGFIGKHLHYKLKTIGYNVIVFEGDVSKNSDFNKYEALELNHCIHLASKSFVPDSWKNPDVFFQTNVCGIQNTVEFCKNNNLTLTYLSSYLYGNPKKLPIQEKDELNPTNPYAFTKYLAENICKFYAEHFGLNISIIRPFNIYGPGQSKVFLIPELIQKFYSAQTTINVLDMKPKRDFLFVDDLIELILLTVENTQGYIVFNAGSGYSMSVQEVIHSIAKTTKISKPIVSADNIRINEIQDTIADISKAKKILGWSPKVDFEEGIIKTLTEEGYL